MHRPGFPITHKIQCSALITRQTAEMEKVCKTCILLHACGSNSVRLGEGTLWMQFLNICGNSSPASTISPTFAPQCMPLFAHDIQVAKHKQRVPDLLSPLSQLVNILTWISVSDSNKRPLWSKLGGSQADSVHVTEYCQPLSKSWCVAPAQHADVQDRCKWYCTISTEGSWAPVC